jgi:caspase domain-containing protein
MSLVVDRRAALGDQPSIHALIAGVSKYTYLPGGGGDPTTEFYFNLPQLDSTARTANLICEWLEKADADGRLPLPLGTIRLLLSPSDAEADLPKVTECTWPNFSKEAKEWRADAGRNDRNLTFFYFTGHGIEVPPQRSILLMQDYGKPDGATLDATVDTAHIFLGMAPPPVATLKQMARTQFYFIDACRTPADVPDLDFDSVRKIWTIATPGVDDRAKPTYFGAPPGAAANALPGKQTLFSEALLDCLNGMGAAGPEGDDPRWRVNSLSLTEGMTLAIQRVNEKYKDQNAQQSFAPESSSKATLVYFSKPPEIEVEMKIDPMAALNLFRFVISDDEDQLVENVEPIDPHPFVRKLPAGQYVFRAQLLNGNHPVYKNRFKSLPVVPPRVPWTAKVMA